MSKPQRSHPWWEWVQVNLDRLGWSTGDLARETDMDHVRFSRWRKGDGPSIDSARTVAQAFDRADPDIRVTLIDALIAANLISESEADARSGASSPRIISPGELARVSTAELLAEISRRIPSVELSK